MEPPYASDVEGCVTILREITVILVSYMTIQTRYLTQTIYSMIKNQLTVQRTQIRQLRKHN